MSAVKAVTVKHRCNDNPAIQDNPADTLDCAEALLALAAIQNNEDDGTYNLMPRATWGHTLLIETAMSAIRHARNQLR